MGAGPADLACATVLARGGAKVVLSEWKDRVGHRFHDDFQGLENWTRATDALEELAEAGIASNLKNHAFDRGTLLDPAGRRCDQFHSVDQRTIDVNGHSVMPHPHQRLQIGPLAKRKQVMEEFGQTPTDHPVTTSVQPNSLQSQSCCGRKAGASEAPQDAIEPPVDIESAPAPAKGSSGCCCGHR